MLVTKGAPEAVLARCAEVPPESTGILEGMFATATGWSPSRRARRWG